MRRAATMPPTSRAPGRSSTCRSARANACCATTPTPPRIRHCSTAKGNGLCVTCHQRRRSAVAFAHAPVAGEKGCLSCHSPHSAENEQLLTADAGPLCASCHAKTKEAGAESEDAACARRDGRVHRLPRCARLERQGHPEGQDGPRLLRLPHRRRDHVHQDLHAPAGAGRRVHVVPPAARLRRRRSC